MSDNTANNTTVNNQIHRDDILSRLASNHCQVEVKQTNKDGFTTSIGVSEILNFIPEKNSLLFDAINHQAIQENNRLKIFAKQNGIDIHFSVNISNIVKRNHLNYFNTNLPDEIIYKQRRQQYRVELQNLWKIPVTLISKKIKKPLTAYIYNISAGGMKVRSSIEDFNSIKKDSVIETLIQLPNNTSVQCKLQVRQTQVNTKAGFQQLAGQFLNLDSKQEKTIQSFVNTVERNIIKNNSQLHAI